MRGCASDSATMDEARARFDQEFLDITASLDLIEDPDFIEIMLMEEMLIWEEFFSRAQEVLDRTELEMELARHGYIGAVKLA